MTILASAEVIPAYDENILPPHRELVAAMGAGYVSAAVWLAVLCANAFGECGTRVSGSCALDIGSLFVLFAPETPTAAITYVELTSRHHGVQIASDEVRRIAHALLVALDKSPHALRPPRNPGSKHVSSQTHSSIASMRDVPEGHIRLKNYRSALPIALPLLAAVTAAGVAGAVPGQPGIAVPSPDQPGVTSPSPTPPPPTPPLPAPEPPSYVAPYLSLIHI